MKNHDDEMQLRLDLLVDEELPEEERRELLLALDREPGKWRDLSMRFLERQVEKQSAREWISGGTPAHTTIQGRENEDAALGYKFPAVPSARIGRAIAAGLLVAAVSAVVTLYAVRRPAESGTATGASALATGDLQTHVPGEAMNIHGPIPVNVPMVSVRNVDQPWFPAASDQEAGTESRRSVVIQPDGYGNAVVIPVSTLPMKFY